MSTIPSPVGFSLRQATANDAATIRRIIALVQINPMGLIWHRFILAVDEEGEIVGCGQVKPHADGSLELASIAVLPSWRGQGIARAIIARLLQDYPGTLYLTCRSQLGPMYQKFGFQALSLAEMPTYFRRLSCLVRLVNKLLRQSEGLLVMRRK